MIHRYSLVIHPHKDIIELFKVYKDILFSKVEWFHSRDSIAHITILEFEATENEAKTVIEKIMKITDSEISFKAIFNQVVYSKNIFVLPNGNEQFEKLLGRIRRRIKGVNNTSSAHLTIGRELKPEQIVKSQNLFPDINFEFECNQLALRKLNPIRKQFDILQIFPLTGKENTDQSKQGSFDF